MAIAVFVCYLLATICGWCAVFTQPVFSHSGLALAVAFIALGLCISCFPAVRPARTNNG